MKRTLLMLCTAAVLGGCAALNTVQGELSTWGDWPDGRAPGTYAFDRLPSQQSQPEQTARLEQAARPALERAGFVPAPDGTAPDLLVQVAARSTQTASDPWIDPLWWRGGYVVGHRGWVGPSWHFGGYLGGPFDHRRYQRQVAVLLRDRATGQPLYEARVANEGSTQGGDALVTALFQAALVDFPRNGINPRTVSVTAP